MLFVLDFLGGALAYELATRRGSFEYSGGSAGPTVSWAPGRLPYAPGLGLHQRSRD